MSGELTELVTLPTVVSAMLLASSPACRSPTSSATARSARRSPRCPTACDPLLAKPIVQVAIAFVVTAAIVVAGWIAGSALADGTQSLDDEGVKASLVGVVLLAVGLALLGYGLGLLIRNSAAAICLLLLWPLIAEGLVAGLLTVVGGEGLVKFLPYSAGINMVAVERPDDSFDRVTGGVYFFVWVAVILVLGIISARRRDA